MISCSNLLTDFFFFSITQRTPERCRYQERDSRNSDKYKRVNGMVFITETNNI